GGQLDDHPQRPRQHGGGGARGALRDLGGGVPPPQVQQRPGQQQPWFVGGGFVGLAQALVEQSPGGGGLGRLQQLGRAPQRRRGGEVRAAQRVRVAGPGRPAGAQPLGHRRIDRQQFGAAGLVERLEQSGRGLGVALGVGGAAEDQRQDRGVTG